MSRNTGGEAFPGEPKAHLQCRSAWPGCELIQAWQELFQASQMRTCGKSSVGLTSDRVKGGPIKGQIGRFLRAHLRQVVRELEEPHGELFAWVRERRERESY